MLFYTKANLVLSVSFINAILQESSGTLFYWYSFYCTNLVSKPWPALRVAKSTTMARIFLNLMIVAALFTIASCSNSGSDKSKESTTTTTENTATPAGDGSNPKGIGPHQNVELTHPLDEKMVADGKSIYDVKCASCHKTTDEKLVGPGWKGVTDRRTPEWIMNFITNTDEMIEKDTAAQHLLEVCLVKMPNQNLSEQEARSTLEFMRKNDGKK